MKIALITAVAFFLTVGVAVACYNPEYPPVVDEPQPSQEPTPSDIVVTVEPTEEASPSATAFPTPGQDGKGSGVSDGKSSCSECTQPHNEVVVPSAPPQAGLRQY